jgi:hypothetical protein
MTGFDGNKITGIIGSRTQNNSLTFCTSISANLYENAKNYVASLFGTYTFAPALA